MEFVDDFEALVRSLGEHVVDRISPERLREVEVAADDRMGTADISIVLREHSWAEQSRAIDKMIEIRETFLGDISISYRFVSPDEMPSAANQEEPLQLAFA